MLVEAAEASNLPANNLEHVFVFFPGATGHLHPVLAELLGASRSSKN